MASRARVRGFNTLSAGVTTTVLSAVIAAAIAGNSHLGTGGITTSAVLTNATGRAPLPVFLDASATTCGSTSRPFEEILYITHWGDGTSTYSYGNRPGVNNRNVSRGAYAAHTYPSTGTFTVKTTPIYMSAGLLVSVGTTVSNTVTVNSTEDAFYPTTNTKTVSTSGTFTGEPSGASHITTSSFTTALGGGTPTANTRYLFRGNETFSIDSALVIGAANVTIGAFGGGVPIFTFSNRSYGVKLNGNSSNASGFTWDTAKFDGVTTDTGATSYKNPVNTQNTNTTPVSNILLRNLECDKAGAIASVSRVSNMHIDTCNAHDLSGLNGNVGFYTEFSDKIVIQNSAIVDCYGIEHNIRHQGSSKLVISNNTLRQAGVSGKQIITIRGWSQQETGNIELWSGNWAGEAVISDNYIDGGSTGTGNVVQFAPQNAGAFERIRNIVFERNFVTGLCDLPLLTQAESGITIRSNIFNITDTTPSNPTIWVQWNSSTALLEPTQTDIYNNTVYAQNATVFTLLHLGIFGKTYLTSGNVDQNNLGYSPSAVNPTDGSGGSTPKFFGGYASTGYTHTTNSSNAQIKSTSPSFISTPPGTTLANYQPQSGSYAKAAGTVRVGMLEDFFLTSLDAGSTFMGAVKPA